MNFVAEVLPRLRSILEERGERVVVIAGPPTSVGERLRRRARYLRAGRIFHTGNRVTFAPFAHQVVILRDRGLFPTPGGPPRRGLRQRVRKALAVHALAFADEIVVPTRAMAEPIDDLRRRFHLLPSSPIHVVPYGAPAWEPPPLRSFNDPVALLFVGIPASHKNLPILARVLGHLKASAGSKVRLTVTATPEHEVDGKELREWFAGVADDVSFAGSVSRSELPRLYAEHDILVFPSHYESFGQPLVEGMTMGIPIVAADRDWAHEICGDAAVYARVDDPRAWAEAISGLAGTGRRENPAGIARAKLFDWDRTARSYADLLRP